MKDEEEAIADMQMSFVSICTVWVVKRVEKE